MRAGALQVRLGLAKQRFGVSDMHLLLLIDILWKESNTKTHQSYATNGEFNTHGSF